MSECAAGNRLSAAVQAEAPVREGVLEDAREFLGLLAQVCYSSAEMGTTLRRVHLLLPSPEELLRYEVLLQTLVERRGRKT